MSFCGNILFSSSLNEGIIKRKGTINIDPTTKSEHELSGENLDHKMRKIK
jgi:hypothetical protein